MKRLLPLMILSCLLTISANGQSDYPYEPNEDYPYGRPNPNSPEQIRDYHEMIGACDCTSIRRNPDQSWGEPQPIIWTFKYIMNGMAVQDGTLKPDGIHSGSIRQFNRDSTRWYVHYFSTGSAPPTLPSWGGGREGNEIILYRPQRAPNGMEGFYKIRFHEISEDGFKWLGAWTNEDESIVFETWKIDCMKRGR